MTAVIEVDAPPEVPQTAAASALVFLLPVVMSVVTLAATVGALVTGSPVGRSPGFLVFPVMMLASLAVTVLTGRGRRRGAAIDADRDEYFAYLSGLRDQVTEVAATQYISLLREFPDPDCLWTVIGSPQMWARRIADAACYRVRVGVGSQPLAARLVAAPTPPEQRRDPVTAEALQRFLDAHSTIDGPIVVPLSLGQTVTIDGGPSRVRGLIRAIVCQLAVFHAPEELSIVAVGSGWDWLKWLPHNQHPRLTDGAGAARMVYPTLLDAQAGLAAGSSPHVLVIVDVPESDSIADTTSVVVGHDAAKLVIRRADKQEMLACPDQLSVEEATVCARRLAAVAGRSWPGSSPSWIRELGEVDPVLLWRNQDRRDRLCVPIGATLDGQPVHLDIKEAAEQGIGPHGLCIGATGSGKSELLRTVALGMLARNSPEVLNLLLVDFKGGATFLDMSEAPHVAAVITNLADEAPLVDRMRAALAGEVNRRQQLLRTAGCVSLATYEQHRPLGSPPLPALFIIVDEFSELLSQHPDFAEMFVTIGRVGRSLGMHLLLASQRLDEGRLRGLEAHLSYRMCLKTLSASESRAILGTPEAYHLPNTPGAGYLRTASGDLIRFQSAFVSGPGTATLPAGTAPAAVSRFPAETVGQVRQVIPVRARSVMRTVLDRIEDQGPPAHPVWLPPLNTAPTLGALLRDGEARHLIVPIGVVDHPYEQSRGPLIVDLSGAAGNVAVVGAPQAGKSTALCTLITALAATHEPSQAQFYCLDFGGGSLSAMGELPHVGGVADRSQPDLAERIVAEMESAVRTREARVRAGSGTADLADVFLVIDGWVGLRHEFDHLEETIAMVATQGLSCGVHVVLSASRWAEIRPALKDQLGTRIELRLGDPADSDCDRAQARQVPRDHPGRGLSPDGLQMVVARPELEEVEVRCGGPVAPPVLLLPTKVDHQIVIAEDRTTSRILLGLGEGGLEPVGVDLGGSGHLLILGDNGCGKTSALRTLYREIVRTKTAAQARLFVVDFRRTLMGVVGSEHSGGYAMSPAALTAVLPGLVDLLRSRMPAADVSHTQLRTRSWWAGPDIYLLVDDYDLVANASGNPLHLLLEYLPYAKDLGLHLVVARRSGGAARALFDPLLASLTELGCTGLLMSGRAEDGVLLGSKPGRPLPPGRGVLITQPGVEQLVQVGWTPPA
ncbi:type VII secretion protein EccCb [Mycobacterium asiaticum]|uniref:Type VII secretion protein EccCb n=1 Tax=Mycobacterium asiaticum TaxID=1790 RepID=A0A1A3N051_MYCAS|nr:type VII secretion protein EccCb [Mycobacterium asiaticum]OBK15161.1 type VII secretion protein EccCb [Mycobacterium asiaticum]